MATGFNSLSHSFQVADISVRGVPVPNPVFNEFDYFGTLLGLQRLPEETNDLYKARLFGVFTNRASSTYTGLINGITRELGLELYKPLTISLRTDINPAWSPRIEFVDNIVYIWKDITTKTLDKVIPRSPATEGAYFLTGLVDAINTSSVFTAELTDDSFAYTRSDCIVNQSSSRIVQQQTLVTSRSNHLGVRYIDRTSVVFSDLVTFRTEVSSVSQVTSSGKYHINYQTGLIKSFSVPADGANIQYSFVQTPFVPVASPVIIRSLNSPEFQRIVFNQTIQGDGFTTNGIPTNVGADIINELLSVVAMYWGE